MRKNKLFLFFPLLSILGILILSSFFKIPTNPDAQAQAEPDGKKYHSSSQVESSGNLLHLQTSFSNDYYTNQHPDGYFYVQVQADKYYNNNYMRPQMNLSIVIDRSGSMSGQKIENARQAAIKMIDQLQDQDYISIVTYDDNVNVLVNQIQVRNRDYIKNKIRSISPGGSTNLMGGAMKGYEEVNKYYNPNSINRVLLLSDGLANEGITDPNKIKNIIRGKIHEENISISTFGIGADYNEDLMTSMAETGGGNYYFIEKAQDIAQILNKELNGLNELVAQDLSLSIQMPPSVSIDDVEGYYYTVENGRLSVKLHSIFSEETKGILIKYHVTNMRTEKIYFATNLNYYIPRQNKNFRLNTVNTQNRTSDDNVYSDNFNEWADAQVILYTTNKKMEEAMQEIDKGNYDQGRAIVEDTKNYLENNKAVVDKNKELKRAATSNISYSEQIKVIEEAPEMEKKIIQKANKSENYQIRTKK